MIIDPKTLPSITIDCGQLLNACEIKSIMKQLGITDYCYAFIYKSTVMKYGQSGDNDWKRGSYGERIYRQAFHIPGWPTKPSPNTAGKDMCDIVAKFPGINKNDVLIKVWDMTGYNFAIKHDHRHELTVLENTLLSEHVNAYGTLPVGNIKDVTFIQRKTRVTDDIFDSMFAYD